VKAPNPDGPHRHSIQAEVVVHGARVAPQAGDGSCLFHSLSHGLKRGGNGSDGGGNGATVLRAEIADFVLANPELDIADTPLREWVMWDSQLTVCEYAELMRTGSRWGGAIEMAVCAKLKNAHVHVYEAAASDESGCFKRISCFDGGASSRTITVVYGGRVHYDALELEL
jgi:hypothetical protein